MERIKALIYKLFGLKGFIWMTATVLLWNGKLTGSDWVMISGATGLLNVAQKHKDLGGQNGSFDVPTS